jgi:hypothetical protein
MRNQLTFLAAAIALALGTSVHAADTKAIDQEHKAEVAKCKDMKGNAKDVCKKEADGKQKVAKAEAEAKEHDTAKNRLKVAEARADAKYDVAKERCDDQKGDAKDACQKAAKAERDGAKAQAQKASLNDDNVKTKEPRNETTKETRKKE